MEPKDVPTKIPNMYRAFACRFKGMDGFFMPTEDFLSMMNTWQLLQDHISDTLGMKREPAVIPVAKEKATA